MLHSINSLSLISLFYFEHADHFKTWLEDICIIILQVIRFFTAKYEILQLYPKRAFVFLQRKTKFYSWTQTFICFLQRNAKFRIVSFLLWLWNTKFLKLFRSGHLLLANKLKNLKLHQNCHSFFWPRNAKSEAVLKRSLSIRLQTTKIELNYLLFPWTFNNSKTPDKILR